MENQHKLIKGYRDLSQQEINVMNEVKALGTQCELLLEKIARDEAAPDQRWVSIARTHLQEGIMALVRSIAKPTSF